MGTLRCLFALAVVLQHCTPVEYSISGKSAVQLFYMISGFLISFVLVERKSHPSRAAFYLNRFLRLYPVYAAVAVATLVFILVAHQPASFIDVYWNAPGGALAFLTLTNALLVGQDWLMFFDVKDAHLVFSGRIDESSWLWHGLLAPQAWTLGVELTFYAVAPFILLRKPILSIVLVASVAIRLVLSHFGFSLDPWNYRFFPNELALFLAGALAHQYLLPLYRKMPARQLDRSAWCSTLFLVLVTVCFIVIPLSPRLKTALLFACFFALLPLTFIFQSRHPVDAWIGNLSYPIYICHMLVLWVVRFAFDSWQVDGLGAYIATCIPVTLALAYLLEISISRPLERVRRRVRQGAGTVMELAAAPSVRTANRRVDARPN